MRNDLGTSVGVSYVAVIDAVLLLLLFFARDTYFALFKLTTLSMYSYLFMWLLPVVTKNTTLFSQALGQTKSFTPFQFG